MFKSLLLFAFYLAFAHAAFVDTCPSVGGFGLKKRERLRFRSFMGSFDKNPEECVQECEANSSCGSVEIRLKDQKVQDAGFVCRLFSYRSDGKEGMKPDNRYCSYLKPRNCVGAFGGWTQCSATCGGGVKSRTFSVTTSAMFEGQCSHADGETEERACGTAACPSPASSTCKDEAGINCDIAANLGCTGPFSRNIREKCPATCGLCDLQTEESRVAHIKSENDKLKQANKALRKALETLSN